MNVREWKGEKKNNSTRITEIELNKEEVKARGVLVCTTNYIL